MQHEDIHRRKSNRDLKIRRRTHKPRKTVVKRVEKEIIFERTEEKFYKCKGCISKLVNQEIKNSKNHHERRRLQH